MTSDGRRKSPRDLPLAWSRHNRTHAGSDAYMPMRGGGETNSHQHKIGKFPISSESSECYEKKKKRMGKSLSVVGSGGWMCNLSHVVQVGLIEKVTF